MNLNKNISDHDLALLLREEANKKYFSLFTERYSRYIYQKCFMYVKNNADADDLAQEVQIRVFMKIQGFRSEATLKTWLNSIIYHVCIDFLRKRNSRKPHEIITEKIAETFIDDLDELSAENVDEANEAMLQLLENADEEDKLILILKYKERHSLKEIQGTLGITESALKMRLSRAKSRLQNALNSRKD